MKFFTVTDKSSVIHKILIIQLSETQMNQVSGQCAKCMPSIHTSSLVQAGHPYVVADFGGPDAWKTAIALNETSQDGHKIGDELALGDVLTVILTSKPEAVTVSETKST